MEESDGKKGEKAKASVDGGGVSIETCEKRADEAASSLTAKCVEGDNEGKETSATVCLEDGDDILTLEVAALLSPENIDISALDKVINENSEDLIPDAGSPKQTSSVLQPALPPDGSESMSTENSPSEYTMQSGRQPIDESNSEDPTVADVHKSVKAGSESTDAPKHADENMAAHPAKQDVPDSTTSDTAASYKLDKTSAANLSSLITSTNTVNLGKKLNAGNEMSESQKECDKTNADEKYSEENVAGSECRTVKGGNDEASETVNEATNTQSTDVSKRIAPATPTDDNLGKNVPVLTDQLPSRAGVDKAGPKEHSATADASATTVSGKGDQVTVSSDQSTTLAIGEDMDGKDEKTSMPKEATHKGDEADTQKVEFSGAQSETTTHNKANEDSSKPDVSFTFPNIAAVVSKCNQDGDGDPVTDITDFMGIDGLEDPSEMDGASMIECDIAEGASLSTGDDNDAENEGDEEHPLQIDDEDTESDEPYETDDKRDEDYVPPGKKQKRQNKKKNHVKDTSDKIDKIVDSKPSNTKEDGDDDDCMILIEDSDEDEPAPSGGGSDKTEQESDSQDDVVISKIESRSRKVVQVKTEILPQASQQTNSVPRQLTNPNNRMIEIVCLNATTRQPVWSRVSDKQPNLPKFQGKPGVKITFDTCEPYEFFSQLCGDALVHGFVQGINEKMQAHFSAHPRSVMKLTDMNEFRNFLGILLLFGLDRKPQMDMYWSRDPLLCSPIVRHSMDYGRFTTLLANLNYKNSVEVINPGSVELTQTQALADALQKRFRTVYQPERQLAVTERTIHTSKGGIEYSSEDNCHRRGYHMCHVSDSTGYVYNLFVVDSAQASYSLYPIRSMTLKRPDFIDLSISGKKVIYLICDLMDKGYDVQLDERLTTDWLLIYLRQHLTTGFGTCSANNAPEPLRSTPQKITGFRSGQVLAMKMFTDKENTFALSTKHSDAFVSRMASQAGTVQSRHDNVMQSAYKHHDVLRNCNAALRDLNSFTQVVIHLVQIATYNAYIIATRCGYVLPFIDFYKKIVLGLMGIKPTNRITSLDDSVRLHERHFPSFISDDKGYPARQFCLVCRVNRLTKKTAWLCKQCPSAPYLCLPVCYELYHTKYKFWGKAAGSFQADSGGAEVEICDEPSSDAQLLSPGSSVKSPQREGASSPRRERQKKKGEKTGKVRSSSLHPEDFVQILDTPSQPINVISSPTLQQHTIQSRKNDIEIVTDEQTQMNYATLQPVRSVEDVMNVPNLRGQSQYAEGLDGRTMLHLVTDNDNQLQLMPDSPSLQFVQASGSNYQVDGGSDEIQYMDISNNSVSSGSLVRGSEGGEMEVYIISN